MEVNYDFEEKDEILLAILMNLDRQRINVEQAYKQIVRYMKNNTCQCKK